MKHIPHPMSHTTMCDNGKERPMTEAEQGLYTAGLSAFMRMHEWKRAFWIMVVANLVLICTYWIV